MKIKQAEFRANATDVGSIPVAFGPEIAFAGRSNVGKSSLLNKLCRRKSLARTSRTPGCTRGLLFYEVVTSETVCLVDLPGFGYASRSHDERRRWKVLIETYLARREELAGLLILVDVRRGPEEEELGLAEYLESQGIAYAWVLTKTDKLKRGKLTTAVRKIRDSLAPQPVLVTSSQEGAGMTEVWRWILAAVEEGVVDDGSPAGGASPDGTSADSAKSADSGDADGD